MLSTILILATVSMGLIAGLFYTFAISVMPGLRRTGDQAFVDSMRGINSAIQNPAFAASFFGALVFSVWALMLGLGSPGGPVLPVVMAVVLYALTLVVTFGVNIPLNVALDRSRGGDAASRLGFEQRWVRWNILRTLLCTAAFVFLCIALAA